VIALAVRLKRAKGRGVDGRRRHERGDKEEEDRGRKKGRKT